MSSEDDRETRPESHFRCEVCDVRYPASAVDYDRLGYPVCPDCGAGTGPLATARPSRSPARWHGRRVPRRARR